MWQNSLSKFVRCNRGDPREHPVHPPHVLHKTPKQEHTARRNPIVARFSRACRYPYNQTAAGIRYLFPRHSRIGYGAPETFVDQTQARPSPAEVVPLEMSRFLGALPAACADRHLHAFHGNSSFTAIPACEDRIRLGRHEVAHLYVA